jgi:branched-chain amino acid transport system ATP-binding protein
LVSHPQHLHALAAEIHAAGGEAVISKSVLQLDQLEVVYGRAVRAVQGISMCIPDGSTVAVVGLNGSGKTTILRAISGFLPSENVAITQGTIRFRDRDITGWHADHTAARGIVLVPELNKVFGTLTVEENLEVGSRTQSRARSKGAITLSNVFDLFPTLAPHRHRRAIWLSGGERQLLAIAAALIKLPTLLLVDEMSLGLSPIMQRQVIDKLKELKRHFGFSLLVVDQNARAVLEIADYGYIIENGMIVRDGPAQALLANTEVQEFYLGRRSGEGTRPSYRDVKQYRRTRRWWG